MSTIKQVSLKRSFWEVVGCRFRLFGILFISLASSLQSFALAKLFLPKYAEICQLKILGAYKYILLMIREAYITKEDLEKMSESDKKEF